jgi:hypothetical protein
MSNMSAPTRNWKPSSFAKIAPLWKVSRLKRQQLKSGKDLGCCGKQLFGMVLFLMHLLSNIPSHLK